MKKLLFLAVVSMLALNATAQSIIRKYAFEGTLDGTIAVRIAFEVNDQDIAAGEVLYYKTKNAKPILLVGAPYQIDDSFFLREYLADGHNTGNWSLEVSNGQWKGSWYDPSSGKERTLTNVRPIAFPPSMGGKLVPESPDHIGKEYSYWFNHPGYGEPMGGHFSFTGAGKNRVSFTAANVPSNIAEGNSEKGRPAELQGNHFTYLHMNECDYGFEAYFFTQFMMVRDVTCSETFYCFGAHTTLEAIYIKTKQ